MSLVMNSQNFGAEPAAFKAHIDRIAREYLASRRAEGVERLYLPGELETEIAARNLREGIPLNEATIAGIVRAGEELGVRVDTLRYAVR